MDDWVTEWFNDWVWSRLPLGWFFQPGNSSIPDWPRNAECITRPINNVSFWIFMCRWCYQSVRLAFVFTDTFSNSLCRPKLWGVGGREETCAEVNIISGQGCRAKILRAKMYSLFIWNSDLTGHPIFLFAKADDLFLSQQCSGVGWGQ